jgi:hypothetical protein
VFKRSVTIEEPKLTTAYDSAREHLGPALDSAKETGSHALQAALAAMIPVVAAAAPAVAAARSKGSELLNSDTAQEARTRAGLMMAAAKGEPIATGKRRRWRLALAFFAVGSAVGALIAMFSERMRAAGEEYDDDADAHAGANVDLSHPLTEKEPQPVNVLPDVTDSGSRPSDFADPKAKF